jgi:DNA modification methylase/transcriptional regulator with XRE-family HTH domain
MSHIFGARLLELRERAGYTLREVASLLGVDHTYVSHLEAGRRIPREEIVLRVADLFAEDPDVLRIQAGQIPPHVLTLMQRNPQLTLSLISAVAEPAAAAKDAFVPVADLIAKHACDVQVDALDSYQRPPFARHVDAGKNTPIYNAHSYHTKVPHQGIIPYIEHYTEPGHLVLDPFCGSGMTGVAAVLSGRDAVLNDLSPAAVHIARNYITPCPPQALETAYEDLTALMVSLERQIYGTQCSACGGPALIEYSIYTDIFACSRCSTEISVWEHGRDAAGRLIGYLECPGCGARHDKNELTWLRSVPCAINSVCSRPCSAGRSERLATDADRVAAASHTRASVHQWIPETTFGPEWEMWRHGHRDRGIESVAGFFTGRNLKALAALHDHIRSLGDGRVPAALLFAFTGCVNRASKRYQWNHKRPTNVLSGTLYVSSLFYEFNVFRLFQRKIRATVRMLAMIERANGSAAVMCGSATRLNTIPNDSIDYVFTDPPFGSNIYYSDCSLLWEAWLGDLTDREREMVIGKGGKQGERARSLEDYQAMLTEALREIRRVLKGGRWCSIVFHNSSAHVWEAVRHACIDAGFTLGSAVMFDKKQRSFKGIKGLQAGERVANFDVVLNLQKRVPVLAATEDAAISEARIVEALRQHLTLMSGDAGEERSSAYLHSIAIQTAFNQHLSLTTIDMRRFEALLGREFVREGASWYLLSERPDTNSPLVREVAFHA